MPEAPSPRSDHETVFGLDPRALLSRAARPQDAGEDSQRMGDYELLDRIAEGGMGVVYRAHQVSLQRTVALKMIRSGLLATPSEVQRFRREAEAAASLDHPHIVPIYEIGESERRHFFSMKFIEGGNLAELCAVGDDVRRGGAEWARRAAGIVATVARALHHAHQRGVLHRDVKPTNVLLDEHGEPHLTDFGLAKLAEGGSAMTMTLAVIGTPNYMAPEQAAGDHQQLTVAADIYSLGAVLYELLAGRPPFEGDSTLELLRQVQEREPPALRKSNAGLNRDLETICLKCLQKEPQRRYATAEELAADLDRWLAGKPILARPVAPLEKFWLWSRRNPVATLAGVLLLALAGVSTVAALRLREKSNEINENLRSSYLAQAKVQRVSTVPDRRSQSLRVLTEAARIRPSMEVRNEVIAALALPELGPPQTWRAAKLQRHTPQRMLTADGERYAVFGQQDGITVHRRLDGAVLAELTTPPNHLSVGKISPDGRHLIIFDQARSVFVWDLSRAGRGPHKHSLALPEPCDRAADYLPDGHSLALACMDKRVRFYDLESGAERMQFELPFVAQQIVISPAGDQLALSAGGSLFVWRISPAGQIRSHKHHSTVTAFAWHPHGRFIAVGYENGEVQLLDSISGASRWLTPHQQYAAVAFDVRGEIVASASFDSTHRYADPATGRVLFETRETGGLQATSDGRYFAAFPEDGSIIAREILRSGVFRTLTSARTGYPGLSGVDISPDARWLVAGDIAGLHVWNMAQGNEVAFVASASAARPRFHPDGRFIVTGGDGGQLRWPFTVTADGTEVRAGPPELLVSASGSGVHFTPDGQWLAVPGRLGSLVLNWSDPSQRVVFGQNLPPNRHDHVVLSPDRKWAAGASYGGVGVTVWNAHDGSMLRHLIENKNADLAVSPDGHTLATATASELVLWDTATWQPRRRIASGMTSVVPVPVAFSPDGALVAVAATRQEIHLLDAHSGDPLATLTPPLPLNLVTMRFSADGRHLAAQTLGPVIQVWDLQALRSELRTLGLDW